MNSSLKQGKRDGANASTSQPIPRPSPPAGAPEDRVPPDGLIDELRDYGQELSAQLVAMARLELMVTVHSIVDDEMDVLRSLFEDEQHRALS
jgi:hypothetical protein